MWTEIMKKDRKDVDAAIVDYNIWKKKREDEE